MKTATAYCIGGPLDDQRVEIRPCLWFEVRFRQGQDKYETFLYAFDSPKDEAAAVADWTSYPYIARLVPEDEP